MQNKSLTRGVAFLMTPLGMPSLMALTLVAFLCQAGTVRAEGTIGDLSRIQTETLILKARANRASAQAELASKMPGPTTLGENVDAPVVKNVYGVGGRMAATFLYSNGVAVEGHAGDTIIGGFKVVSISIDKVELAKDKKVFQIGFSATPPVQSAPLGAPGTKGAPNYPVVR